MLEAPTVIGRNEDALTRVDQPRFAAAGLFVQWLVEHVTDEVTGYGRVSVELHHEPPAVAGIKLTVRWHEGRVVKAWRWEMGRLNRLLEADDGRGGLLRDEIRLLIEDLREELRQEARVR